MFPNRIRRSYNCLAVGKEEKEPSASKSPRNLFPDVGSRVLRYSTHDDHTSSFSPGLLCMCASTYVATLRDRANFRGIRYTLLFPLELFRATHVSPRYISERIRAERVAGGGGFYRSVRERNIEDETRSQHKTPSTVSPVGTYVWRDINSFIRTVSRRYTSTEARSGSRDTSS